MKKIIVNCILLMLCFYTHAQNSLFVRVYGFDKQLIAKGNLCYGTDSTIEIFSRHHRKIPLMIPVQKVAVIKTGRTFGHHVLVGSAVGFGVLVTAYTVTIASDGKSSFFYPHSLAEGIAIGGLFGITGAGPGGAIGAVTALFAKRRIFLIDGDNTAWQKVRNAFLEMKVITRPAQ